jgi:hypothetical protein
MVNMHEHFGRICCLHLQGRRASQVDKTGTWYHERRAGTMAMNEPTGTNGFLYHEPSNFIPFPFFLCLTYFTLLHASFHLMLLSHSFQYKKPFSRSLVPTASVPILPFLYHVTIFLLGLLFYPEDRGRALLQLDHGSTHLPGWEPQILYKSCLSNWFFLPEQFLFLIYTLLFVNVNVWLFPSAIA